MSKEQLENTYLNKSIAIDYEFHDIIGIETPAVNRDFQTVGLLTKLK